MKNIGVISTLMLLTLLSMDVRSQGCSDAGVCTIHGMTSVEKPDTIIAGKNAISTGVFFGESQHSVVVLTPFVEYTREFGKHISITTKFNYGLRMGELGDTHGPSDILLSMGYSFLNHFTLTGGFKIPLSDGNLELNGQPLPMNYQVSLGTYDIMFGLGYNIKRFSFIAGYQQPVTQNNNQFLAAEYPDGSPELKYFSTRNYNRAADIMLRVSYKAIQSKRIHLTTSVLPIYHLQNDTYQKADGERVSINGSQGITLNINITAGYQILENQLIEFIIGAPVISRDIRPDGLSKFAVGITYGISF